MWAACFWLPKKGRLLEASPLLLPGSHIHTCDVSWLLVARLWRSDFQWCCIEWNTQHGHRIFKWQRRNGNVALSFSLTLQLSYLSPLLCFRIIIQKRFVRGGCLCHRKQPVKAQRLLMLWRDQETRTVGGSWGKWSCSAPCVWSGSPQIPLASTPRTCIQWVNLQTQVHYQWNISSCHCSSHSLSLPLQNLSSLYDQLRVSLQRVPPQRQHILPQETSE